MFDLMGPVVLRVAKALGLSMVAATVAGTARAEIIVLEGATVIDGSGGPVLANASVIIDGDRIRAVARGAERPPGARVIDLTGKYILPGLWDKHLHYKDWMPEMLISNGVTSVTVPDGVDGKQLTKLMYDRWHVMVAGGQGDMAGKIFRFAHMGFISADDVLAGLEALEASLSELGYQRPAGASTKAARAVLGQSTPMEAAR